jgi:hypothetical protein
LVLFGNIKKFKNKFGFLKDCSYINDIEKIKVMSNNKQSTTELINKWKANPDEFGVYDIISGLSWLAEKYNNQDAKKLANEIIDNEEYEINYLISLVEKRLIQGGDK